MDIFSMVLITFITLLLVAKVFGEDEKTKNEDEAANNETEDSVKK